MSKRNSASISGVTLLDVLLLAVIGGMASLTVMSYFDQQRIRNSNLGSQEMLLSRVLDVVEDVKTTILNELPASDRCRSFQYSTQGIFESENEPLLTNVTCTNVTPDSPGIKVTVRQLPASQINATFKPAEFLKLPQHVPTMVEVLVEGGMLSDGNNPSRSFSVSLYRLRKP